MKPPQVISLLAISCAAFAAGVAADRFLFSHSESSDDGGRPLSIEISQQATGSESADKILPNGSHSPDPDEHLADTDVADDRSPPTTIEQVIDRLDHGVAVDFSHAVALLDQLPAGDRRRHFIERIASHWGHKDPAAALAWADELSGADRSRAMEHILHEWAEVDPASAADYAAQLPNSGRSLDWVDMAARVWAEQDQEAAIAWGVAQQDPAVRRRALRGAAGNWANNDPAAAGAFAATLESRYDRHSVLEEVAHRWAEQDAEEALTWAESLGGDDRIRATSEILHQLAGEDPKLAAQKYDQLAPSLPGEVDRDGARAQIARELASRWSENAPREAGDWAMTLPESGEVQREAVREVAHHWLRSDSLAASEWIANLPEGKARDSASGVVVEHVVRSDHESAFAWAKSVSDKGYQAELMHHVLERWNENDPSAARAALNNADLRGEQREHFNEIFRETPEGDERP